MPNTFVDKESLGSVRAKLNANTLSTEQLIVKGYDYKATVDQDNGTITGQNSNSMTDTTKGWVANQFIGSVVKLMTTEDEEDYAIVASNTSNTLTFDDDTLDVTFSTYRILSTFTTEDINSIISFDIRDNCCALVLPSVSTVDERTFVQAYVELSNNGDHKVAIVCKGTDRQRVKKWGALIHKYESVTLWSHLLNVPHWDILNLENVKRFANLVTTANLPINSATYANILSFASASLPYARRFDLIDLLGIGWLKYKSIVITQLGISGSLVVSRTGGGTSLVEITVRKKRFSDGAIIDSTVATVGKYSGDETKTLPLDITLEIEPNDELTIIARRDAGTINLLSGSSIVIKEM